MLLNKRLIVIIIPFDLNLLCKENKLVPINGLISDLKVFDSSFTYFRGEVKSQNDWCITNKTNCIHSFKILEKEKVSDHCPLSIKVYCKRTVPLEFLNLNSKGHLDYSFYDKSTKLKPNKTLRSTTTKFYFHPPSPPYSRP